MLEKNASLFVVSAPSGAGKTSLVKALIEQTDNIQVSVSHTTRPQRPGEVDGVNYHFVDKTAFFNMIDESRFLEQAEVFGNFYGTSQDWVEETLSKGIDVILEIDWQGAEQIRKQIDCCCIFILPPSLHALKDRLTLRGQDNETVIAKRMADAKSEISHFPESDFLIINEDFNQALNEFKAIVLSQRCKTALQAQRHIKLLQELQS